MTIPRRRWLRFSLRTMLIGVLATTVVVWCTLWGVNERRRMRFWVVRRGGDLMYYKDSDYRHEQAWATLSRVEHATRGKARLLDWHAV